MGGKIEEKAALEDVLEELERAALEHVLKERHTAASKEVERLQTKSKAPPYHTRLSIRTDAKVNHWIMLTNMPRVFVSNPLRRLLRDQLLTFGVFSGQ